jgi:tubulysin polyketide synthase-like protein
VTAKQLIAAARTAGIGLDPRGDRLAYQALRGGLTPHLRDALVRHKLDLLAVLWRLDAMRRLGVDLSGDEFEAATPNARLDARGGPGRCFSCGDSLGHPAAYGRCPACDVACELFYEEQPTDREHFA